MCSKRGRVAVARQEAELQSPHNRHTLAIMASAAAPNVKSAFKSIDTAGEGSIDRADVGRLLQLLNPGHTITQNDVLFALKEVEITDDGRVKYTEFKKWFDRLRKVLAACLRRLPRVWPFSPHHTTTSTTSDSLFCASAYCPLPSPPPFAAPVQCVAMCRATEVPSTTSCW